MASSANGEVTAALVPGRDDDGGMAAASESNGSFLLFEVGRGDVGSVGWPKTRPAAAAATTVPVPTS